MDELIEKYGLPDTVAMVMATFRIVEMPSDVAPWLASTGPADRAFDHSVAVAVKQRRRNRWARTVYDDWGCIVAAGEGDGERAGDTMKMKKKLVTPPDWLQKLTDWFWSLVDFLFLAMICLVAMVLLIGLLPDVPAWAIFVAVGLVGSVIWWAKRPSWRRGRARPTAPRGERMSHHENQTS